MTGRKAERESLLYGTPAHPGGIKGRDPGQAAGGAYRSGSSSKAPLKRLITRGPLGARR